MMRNHSPPSRDAPSRSGFGTAVSRAPRPSLMSSNRDAPDRSGFGRSSSGFASREAPRREMPAPSRDIFGSKAPSGGSAFGRSTGGESSGFGRRTGGFGRSNSAPRRESPSPNPSEGSPEYKEAPISKVVVRAAPKMNPWADRQKPAAPKPSKPPTPPQDVRALQKKESFGGRRQNDSFGPPRPNANVNGPFVGSSEGFTSHAFGSGAANSFMGTSGGFGASLLMKSLTHGGLGTDHGSARLSYSSTNSPAASREQDLNLDGISKDSRRVGSARFSKPEANDHRQNKGGFAPRHTPIIPAKPDPVEAFPSLAAKTSAPQQRRLNIPPKPPSAKEMQRQRAEIAKSRAEIKKRKEDELRKRQEDKQKLAKALIDACDSKNNSSHLNPVTLEQFSAGVVKLLKDEDLEEDCESQIFLDLCVVLANSFIDNKIQIISFIEKVKSKQKLEGEVKEKLLVSSLQALSKKMGANKVYNFLQNDHGQILEALGAPADQTQQVPFLREMGLEFLITKVDLEEKLKSAFASKADPSQLMDILDLCDDDGIAHNFCVMVLDFTFGLFFADPGLDALSWLQGGKTSTLILRVKDAMDNSSAGVIIDVAALKWQEDSLKKKCFKDFLKGLIEAKLFTVEDILEWKESSPSKEYRKCKMAVLFTITEWLIEIDPKLRRLKHGSEDEEESEPEEDDSSEQVMDDYLGDWRTVNNNEDTVVPTGDEFSFFG